MVKLLPASGVICALAAAYACPAKAGTVDTFDFTQAGWVMDAGLHNGMLVPNAADPGGILKGSFTGTVEPSGLIQLGDLSAFSVTYSDAMFPGGRVSLVLGDINLFSFNTMGGASSLDIDAGPANRVCVGAAVPLSADCTTGFAFTYPPGTNGAVFDTAALLPAVIPIVFTAEQPVITLVSSVTTSPVPEPPGFAVLIGGLLGFGLAHRPRRSPAAL